MPAQELKEAPKGQKRDLPDTWAVRVFGTGYRTSHEKLLFAWRFVLVPYGVLHPLLESPGTKKWRWIHWSCITLVVLIPIALELWSRVWPAADWLKNTFLYFGYLLNILSLIVLYAVYYYLMGATQILDNTDKLLGHKVWARPRTHDLLQELMDKEKFGRAKWQLVNFLAHLAEDRVEGDKEDGFFSVGTESDGAWHIATYSRFLSDNIEHAQDEVFWLVDPDDFVTLLLPECLEYVLASVCAERLGLPDGTAWETPKYYSNVFKPITEEARNQRVATDSIWELDGAVRERVLSICGAGGTICFKGQSQEYTWEVFEQIILPGMTHFGRLMIEKDPAFLNETFIEKGFEKLYQHWLKSVFPHIAAFRRCPASTAVRIVVVPRGKTRASEKQANARPDDKAVTEDVAVKDLALRIYKVCASRNLFQGIEKIEGRLKILELALGLFSRMSGGDHRIVAVIPPEEKDVPCHLDIGVYDHRFYVWSLPCGNLRSNVAYGLQGDVNRNEHGRVASRFRYRRRVSWYYIEDWDKAKAVESFPGRDQIGFAKNVFSCWNEWELRGCGKLRSYPYLTSRIVAEVRTYLEQQESPNAVS